MKEILAELNLADLSKYKYFVNPIRIIISSRFKSVH